jgi:hypothetical protein
MRQTPLSAIFYSDGACLEDAVALRSPRWRKPVRPMAIARLNFQRGAILLAKGRGV